jgi:NADPH:quinone reductase-like Zn-dependent oxidoreductase
MILFYLRRISPEGVDIILDCLCGDDCNRGYGLLKPMGKYILFGSSNVVTGETKSFFSVARSVNFCFSFRNELYITI